jgi:hypothetical protein
MRSLSGIWLLKHWLEFHIFLCTLGPILVLFHTSFKFGGLVSISFWSMVAVVASGVVGRFIYLQIPRTLQGRELSLHEISEMRGEFSVMLEKVLGVEKWQHITELINRSGKGNNLFYQFYADWQTKRAIRKQLMKAKVDRENLNHVMDLVSHELGMKQKIERLQLMQKLFNYWHVIHLPFAIVMLVIMLVHVGITLAFGYRWIF